jgi:hypothetical protein
MLAQAVDLHLPLDEERVVSFKEAEIHAAVKEEEVRYMDLDTGASAHSGGAGREQASPCFTTEEEHLIQHYARVLSPDIAARFQRPVWKASETLEIAWKRWLST